MSGQSDQSKAPDAACDLLVPGRPSVAAGERARRFREQLSELLSHPGWSFVSQQWLTRAEALRRRMMHPSVDDEEWLRCRAQVESLEFPERLVRMMFTEAERQHKTAPDAAAAGTVPQNAEEARQRMRQRDVVRQFIARPGWRQLAAVLAGASWAFRVIGQQAEDRAEMRRCAMASQAASAPIAAIDELLRMGDAAEAYLAELEREGTEQE